MKLRYIFGYILAIAMIVSSCTYFAPNRSKLEDKMVERGRELNSGALLATREAQKQIEVTKQSLNTATTNLQGEVTLIKTNFNKATNSVERASYAVDLAEEFLNRNENLQGKPIKDQTEVVKALLSENFVLKTEAQLMERYRKHQEENWAEKQANYERRLIDYGTKYEQERNEKITRWIKWGSILFAIIAIPIALCVLFPPVLSIFAGIFPRLIGAFGVTSVKAVSNVTRAVGDVRWEFKKAAEIAPTKTYTAVEVQAILDAKLKEHIEDDKATKNIVEYMREKNNV